MRNKRAAISAAFLIIITGILIIGALSQHRCIGQSYQELYVNGQYVGATADPLDPSHVFLEAKKEVCRQHEGEYLLWEPVLESKEGHAFLTPLLSGGELRERLVEKLGSDCALEGEPLSYTVSVGNYRASFRTQEEAVEFLNRAKKEADPEGLFRTEILPNADHESNCLSAVLMSTKETEETEETAETEEPKETETEGTSFVTAARSGVIPVFLNPLTRPETADYVSSGASGQIFALLTDAIAHPTKNRYETGLVDADFLVPVYLYSDFVPADQLADLDTAVAEVTKEEETNKLYTVKGGDTMSGIAERYGLSLDYLLKLNEFTDQNQTIHIDQELIVAVPEPELKLRTTEGILYEEDFTANPIIIPNNDWYNTKEELISEGTTGHREVNAFITYENGVESNRSIAHTTVLKESVPEVIERGTIVPPTYIKPIHGGRFSSGFGRRWGRMHKGVDWACPTGTVVFASSDGVVEYAGWGNGYGNTILLSHPDGRKTRVGHLSKILVHDGQSVKQGETIGLSGSTGRSTGPHVHFEIYINGTQVNPLDYIK
ncbi:MAG: M23 family metallopeptidase [Lachnospiraceae bacterium]|nr:M23 family metallopeptidase [Lachnospiraceae bacterium]